MKKDPPRLQFRQCWRLECAVLTIYQELELFVTKLNYIDYNMQDINLVQSTLHKWVLYTIV